MALTWSERESVTDDYFMTDGGKAVDIYFQTSFLLNYLMKQKKGLWERPPGGEYIRIPLEYDGQEAGFYVKGDTISSDDRTSINSARFSWKHSYGNATIYRIDELQNSGDYAAIKLTEQRVAGAQKSITKLLADSIYDDAGGASNRLTGFRACCNSTAGTAYGNIEQEDLVAADGTFPWTGRRTATTEGIALDVIRTLCSSAHVRDGQGGDPDLVVTTLTLYNVILSIIQLQQRFTTSGGETAKVGFTGIEFEGKSLFPDDFCPSGYAFAINSNFVGFAIHPDGYFMRSPWRVIPDSAEDKTMKIYWDGNLVVSNRKAHAAHSNLS